MRGLLENFAGRFDCKRTICMILPQLFRFKHDIFSNRYVQICFFPNAPFKNTHLNYFAKICFKKQLSFQNFYLNNQIYSSLAAPRPPIKPLSCTHMYYFCFFSYLKQKLRGQRFLDRNDLGFATKHIIQNLDK